jgi:hypothetical protein
VATSQRNFDEGKGRGRKRLGALGGRKAHGGDRWRGPRCLFNSHCGSTRAGREGVQLGHAAWGLRPGATIVSLRGEKTMAQCTAREERRETNRWVRCEEERERG